MELASCGQSHKINVLTPMYKHILWSLTFNNSWLKNMLIHSGSLCYMNCSELLFLGILKSDIFLSFEVYHLLFAHFCIPGTWRSSRMSHSANICWLNPTINGFSSLFFFLSFLMWLWKCVMNMTNTLALKNLSQKMEETHVLCALLMCL